MTHADHRDRLGAPPSASLGRRPARWLCLSIFSAALAAGLTGGAAVSGCGNDNPPDPKTAPDTKKADGPAPKPGTDPAGSAAASVPDDPPQPDGIVVGDWPWLLGPEHTGLSRETGLLKTWGEKGPPLLWKLEGPADDVTYAAPSIVGNTLILFHRVKDEEVVEALAADTGKRIWRFAYPTAYVDRYGYHGGPRCSPCIDGDARTGRVYTHGAEGKLHCLEIATGKVVWQRDTTADFKAQPNFFGVGPSPLLEGDKVLLNLGGPDTGTIAALDKATGKTLWTATEHGAGYATPICATTPDGKRHALFLTREGAVDVDPADGRVRWTYAFRSRTFESVNAATPLVIGDLVYLSASYRVGAALLRLKGDGFEEVRRGPNEMGNHFATSLHVGGYVYGFDGRHTSDTVLKCVELSTGKSVWTHRGLGRGAMTRADGRFYILSEEGRLVCAELTPAGYKELAGADLLEPVGWIAPVLSRGKLYIRNERTLLCLDVRERK
jgi:outer membrane protein assembly factor BamB